MGIFSRSTKLAVQLRRLAELGFVCNEGVVEADLLAFHTKQELERAPYKALAEVLAGDIERESVAADGVETPLVDRLWMCDFERIEDHGAYRDLLRRLERMTGSALALDSIEDYVDVEAGAAWVRFVHDGDTVRWELAVDDDWLDPEVFHRYGRLLADSGHELKLWANWSDYDQCGFLVACSKANRTAFTKLTRIPLVAVE